MAEHDAGLAGKSFAPIKWLRRIFEEIVSASYVDDAKRVVQVRSYSLDLSSRIFTRSGEVITLAPKTFDLLALLVKSNGRLLSKSELMVSLWPGTFVEEANLSFQISALRKALGEDGVEWIETVPKHGDRFTATVNQEELKRLRDPHLGTSGRRHGRSARICRQQPWR